jgi:hypothetical protein
MNSINRRIRDAKKLKIEFKKLDSFFKQVQSIEFTDLEVNISDSGEDIHYQISLPQILIDEFEVIKRDIEAVGNNTDRYETPIQCIVWGDSYEKFDELEWSITVSKSIHRVDISGEGLPLSFRRLGLGVKMYKRVLLEIGYLVTLYPDSKGYSDLLWDSIISDDDFYSFVSEKPMLCCLRESPPENLLSILQEQFSSYDKIEVYGNPSFLTRFEKELKDHYIMSKLSYKMSK